MWVRKQQQNLDENLLDLFTTAFAWKRYIMIILFTLNILN